MGGAIGTSRSRDLPSLLHFYAPKQRVTALIVFCFVALMKSLHPLKVFALILCLTECKERLTMMRFFTCTSLFNVSLVN